MKQVVPLEKARDDAIFGSKAVGLGRAIRDGLPVPPGFALAGSIVESVAAGEKRAIKEVAKRVKPLGGPLAVRSSAVDEDGAQASFAGRVRRSHGLRWLESSLSSVFLKKEGPRPKAKFPELAANR